jgi:hypothetical protein
VVFAGSLVLLWAAAWGGALLRRWPLADKRRRDFGIILGVTLTMLSIIIGFTFSMASNRYELRKSDEAAEANAIGTEYARAELLPPPNTARVRALLKTSGLRSTRPAPARARSRSNSGTPCANQRSGSRRRSAASSSGE